VPLQGATSITMGESVTHNGDGAFFEARVIDQHPAKIVPYLFKALKAESASNSHHSCNTGQETTA